MQIRVIVAVVVAIQVSGDGYEPQEIDFNVLGDEATLVNVTMRRPVTVSADSLVSPSVSGDGFNISTSSNITSSAEPTRTEGPDSGDASTPRPSAVVSSRASSSFSSGGGISLVYCTFSAFAVLLVGRFQHVA